MRLYRARRYPASVEFSVENSQGEIIRNFSYVIDRNTIPNKRSIPNTASIREKFDLTHEVAKQIRSELVHSCNF